MPLLPEQMDTSTPAGKMVFTVLGAVAEPERSLIVERVRAGMRDARAKGKRIGRPPRTQLSTEMRAVIAGCYAKEKTSLRALAKPWPPFNDVLGYIEGRPDMSRGPSGSTSGVPLRLSHDADILEPPLPALRT